MLQYVLRWASNICTWFIFMQSENIFHNSAGSDVLLYVLQWELSNSACVTFVFLAFISKMICNLCKAVWTSSVIFFRDVGPSVTLFIERVFLMQLSCTVTVYGVADILLNGLRFFGSTFLTWPSSSVLVQAFEPAVYRE